MISTDALNATDGSPETVMQDDDSLPFRGLFWGTVFGLAAWALIGLAFL